jgi:hydrogenase maturation factor HypE
MYQDKDILMYLEVCEVDYLKVSSDMVMILGDSETEILPDFTPP